MPPATTSVPAWNETAPTQTGRTHPSRKRPWRTALIWLAVAALTFVGLRFWTRTILNYTHFDVAHYRQYWFERWWLVAHISGGSLALLLGPFQFSNALRRRYVQAHRWMGKLYLAGVALAGSTSIYMGLVSTYKPFGLALEFLALAWFTTSFLAYTAVRRRQFAAHKEWMIRSYVVTFGFAAFRLLEDLNLFGYLGGGPQSVMLVWMAWSIPLLFVDVILQWRQTMGPRTRKA